MAAAREEQHFSCCELLFTGIPPSVTEDHLINFLECIVPESVVQNVDLRQKAAVVTFESHVDVLEFIEACEKMPLEGQCLGVRAVDKRGAVLIHRPNPSTSTNCFRYYLSNKRRSGGRKVVDINRDKDNTFLIAYFDSTDVADEVSQRKHALENHELHLTLFDPNFDKPPFIKEKPSSLVPKENSLHSSCQTNKTSESQVLIRQDSRANGEDSHVHSSPHSNQQPTDEYRSLCPTFGPENTMPEWKPPEVKKTITIDVCTPYWCVLHIFKKLISEQLNINLVVVANGCVKVEGKQDDVEKVESLLSSLEKKQKLSGSLRQEVMKFSRWNDVFNEISDEIENKYTIDIEKDELYIVLSSEKKSLTLDEFLDMYVHMRIVPVPQEAVDLLETTTWDQFIDEEIAEFRDLVEVYHEQGACHVVGFVKYIDDAEVKVKHFLNDSSYHETIELSSKQRDFLNAFWEDIPVGTGRDYAEVKIGDTFVKIDGFRAGVKHISHKIKKFCSSMRWNRAIFTHPKLSSLDEKAWETLGQEVSSKNHCIISDLPDFEIAEDDEDDGSAWGQWEATVIHSFVKDHLNIHVVEGEAQNMRVDAVVEIGNSAQSQFARGGADVQTEEFVPNREHRDLKQHSKGLHVTQSGARPCRALVHVTHPFYEPALSLEDLVQRLLTDVFQECDRLHFASVALPVIGVDVGIDEPKPIDVATEVIAKFLAKGRTNSSLRHVCLCSCRAACLRGLIYALHIHLTFPTHERESLKFLASSPQTGGNHLHSGTIRVVQDDISRIQADVLVVPCDIDIDLDLNKAKITKSLLHGGPSVQDTLHHGSGLFQKKCIRDRNEELAEDHIVVGSGGRLAAENIIYVYLPPWGCGVKQALTGRVLKCLKKATELGHKSMAMTALGVGKLGYPPQFVARTLFSVVSEYLGKEKTLLKWIIFVLFQCDEFTWLAFKHEESEWRKTITSPRIACELWNVHTVSDVSMISSSSHGSHSNRPTYASVTCGDSGETRKHRDAGMQQQLVYPNPFSPYTTQTCSVSFGDVELRIKIGDICLEKCDVVVNSSNKEFDLNKGAVSRAIKKLNRAGIVSSWKTNENVKTMKKHGCVLTTSGLLPCRRILHMSMDDFWLSPKNNILKGLKHILCQLEDCQSVAFPALGASNRMFPVLVQNMVEAIQGLKNPQVLKKVLLVCSPNVFMHLDRQLREITRNLPLQKKAGPTNLGTKRREEGRSVCAVGSTGAANILMTKVPKWDWARTNVRSVYIFSDTDERRQAATYDIAVGIEKLLGPVQSDTSRQFGEQSVEKYCTPWACNPISFMY